MGLSILFILLLSFMTKTCVCNRFLNLDVKLKSTVTN